MEFRDLTRNRIAKLKQIQKITYRSLEMEIFQFEQTKPKEIDQQRKQTQVFLREREREGEQCYWEKKKWDFKEGEQVAFVRVCENQSKNIHKGRHVPDFLLHTQENQSKKL